MRRRRIIHEENQLAFLGGAGLAAIVGFALGVFVVHKAGGLDGLLRRFARRRAPRLDQSDDPPGSVYEMDGLAHDDSDYSEDEDYDDSEDDSDDSLAIEVENRVLSAFINDPLLSASSIEISAGNDGLVQLHGWVDERADVQHATTIAGGVPGVAAVSNKIRVRRQQSRTQAQHSQTQ